MDTYKVNPVVASSAPEAFGTYSSDGTKIIYQAHIDDNWDIFEYDMVSQNTRQLTDNPSHEENPVYSPDQRYIAFTSTRDDHRDVQYNQKLRDIYTRDLYSDREVNLTTNSSNDWRPRFSSDGKFIVFVSERSDLREVSLVDLFSQVFIMEEDGSFQLELTKEEANHGGAVMVGGEKDPIYFDSNKNGTYDIYKMATDGTGLEQITLNSGWNDVAPDVSSDGVHVVFFSDRDGNYEIYMMTTDGSNQQKLTANPAEDLNPIFSIDGKKILFHSDRFGNYDLFELDLEQKTASASLTEVVSLIDAAMSSM
jgi:Tol biopolymer transport system component